MSEPVPDPRTERSAVQTDVQPISRAMSIVSSPVAHALLVTFLWSTSWVLIKVGLSDDLPPLTFAGLRYTLAASVLVIVLARSSSSRRELASASAHTWGRLFVLGVVFYSVTQAAQFVGLSLLPAATLSLLLSFTPVLVTLVSLRWLGEPATPRQWIGMVVAAVGAGLYLARDLGVDTTTGVIVGLVGLMANAAAALLGRSVNRDSGLGPLAVTTPSMTIGGVLTLVVGLTVEGMPRLGPTEWAIITWLALVNTAFAFTLWNHTLRRLTATESSAINNTMLVQIAVLAWLVLGEALAPVEWLGILVVAVGIALVQRPHRIPPPVGDYRRPDHR